MATRVNRIKSLASNSATRIRLVIGHGSLMPIAYRVPNGTYIIYVSKPGHLLAQSEVLNYPQIFNNRYVRSIIRGETRDADIQPVTLRSWKKHVYGPGDIYPDLFLNLFNHNLNIKRTPGTRFDAVVGVHTLNNGSPRGMYGQPTSVQEIITRYGPGIYVVFACRSSAERVEAKRSGRAFRQFNINMLMTGGTQRYLHRMRPNDPEMNQQVQAIENAQARYTALKRLRNSTTRTNGPKTKKRRVLTPFAPGTTFRFAPGIPTPRVRR